LEKTSEGGKSIKIIKSMLCFISVFVILILAGIWAIGEQTCAAQENEEICGTWLNTEYKGHRHGQKWIFSPDGTFQQYSLESSPSPQFEGNYTITERRTDSEGNIWYKLKATGEVFFGKEKAKWYFLGRIGDSGKTLEYNYHPVEYPKELAPDHPSYRVYYRK
jgi:hypothetical protein